MACLENNAKESVTVLMVTSVQIQMEHVSTMPVQMVGQDHLYAKKVTF